VPAELDGRVAVVTGAARGIGRAIALRLAKAGADLVLADIDLAAGKAYGGELTADSVEAEVVALGRRAISVEGDLSERPVATRVFDQALQSYGRVDVLAVAAGGALSPAETSFATITTEADQDLLFRANYTALVGCCQEAAPHMRAQKSGSIVTIVSQAGSYVQPDGRLAHYAAAKAAAISFTRSLAAELGPDGVRVNAVAPGATLTPRVAALAAERNMVTEESASGTALRRLGLADDIAKVVHFLASDLGGWVTGQCIAATGGQFPLGPF
jgi:3-oxoacyl-[acyl-carrier protein] reductase